MVKRVQQLRLLRHQPNQFTVLVRNIPFCDEHKAHGCCVDHFFSKYHPYTYRSCQILYDGKDLKDLLVRLQENICKHFIYCMLKFWHDRFLCQHQEVRYIISLSTVASLSFCHLESNTCWPNKLCESFDEIDLLYDWLETKCDVKCTIPFRFSSLFLLLSLLTIHENPFKLQIIPKIGETLIW